MKNIAVIGLGSMGMGMAKSLIIDGFTVSGYDLNPITTAALSEFGDCETGAEPISSASKFDAVLFVLVNAAQIESALFESGLDRQLSEKCIVSIHSTILADESKSIAARLGARNIRMIDAPISGGAAKAAIGELTIMAAAKYADMQAIKPVFDAIASHVYHIGEDIGLGSSVKTIHQLLAGVHIAAAAESMAMAAKAGIDLNIMYDVVTHAAGNSWMFENRMQKVLTGDYTPNSMVDIFVKDLGLVLDTAHGLKFPLPLASAAHQMFLAASNEGFGQLDDSAVIKIFKGIKLPE
ncbi:dehydrogenase [Gammaproteobacteria bacterium]|nr:dehydrogenase [Gammaproteobacteria bacterium]